MDETEIKDWLGIGSDPRPLTAEIVEGLREEEFPGDDKDHMRVFTAFLRSVPGKSAKDSRGRIFATRVQLWAGRDGNVIQARYADPPTAYLPQDRHTHRLVRPGAVQPATPFTWCKQPGWASGSEIPGRGPVDCPDCLRALSRDPEA
jgi:hypothetical protein